jgi:hypothetical protein
MNSPASLLSMTIMHSTHNMGYLLDSSFLDFGSRNSVKIKGTIQLSQFRKNIKFVSIQFHLYYLFVVLLVTFQLQNIFIIKLY